MNKPKERQSNLELFRIVSMLFIIAHHYVSGSALSAADGVVYSNVSDPRALFVLILGAFGKTGINCFVLITGYFMCKSRITLKKFIKLYAEVLFYGVTIFLIFFLCGKQPLSLSALLAACLPVNAVAQNFTGTFLLFFLFIPFLTALVHALSQKQHLYLLALVSLTYVFFETIPIFELSMNYVSWYMVLFLFASYLRLYPAPLFEKKTLWGVLSLVFFLLTAAAVVLSAYLGAKLGRPLAYLFVKSPASFLPFALGLASFLFFKNLSVPQSRVINTLSASSFGVLLIHSASSAMRSFLWGDLLQNEAVYSSPYLIPHALLSPFVLYLVCFLIDFLRIRLLEQPFLRLWDKLEARLIPAFRKKEAALLQKLNIPNE